MNGIEALKKRVDALAPAPDCDSHFKEDEAAINAIVLEVWPTFNQDNVDLLTPDGISRMFADPRYREIEKRVDALASARAQRLDGGGDT